MPRKVQHGNGIVVGADYTLDGRSVPYVCDMTLDTEHVAQVREIPMDERTADVIDYDNFVTRFDESPRRVRPDEAASARNDPFHCVSALLFLDHGRKPPLRSNSWLVAGATPSAGRRYCSLKG